MKPLCVFTILLIFSYSDSSYSQGPARVAGTGAPLAVSLSARAMQPGEVVRADVSAAEPLDGVVATAFGRTVVFDLDPQRQVWQALIGIDLDVRPGEYPIGIEAMRGSQPVTMVQPLRVAAKSFRTRRLRVAAAFVNPPPAALDRIQREAKHMAGIFDRVTPRRWNGPFVPPVEGTLTSNFGTRSIFNGRPRAPHAGVDFLSPSGTPIHACNDGRVVLADDLFFTGYTIIIDHGAGLYSLFAHLSQLAVREGDAVGSGMVVGLVGATGRVTGPHLHWSVRLRDARVDPVSLIAAARESGR